MQGVLIAASGGGIGGALGALLGFGLGRFLPSKWRRGLETACAVAFALVGAKLAPMIAGPPQRVEAASIEPLLLADSAFGPMARAWKQSDPAAFQDFVTRIAASGERAAAIESARVGLSVAARPRLRYLSDADLVNVIRLARDQMIELKISHPVVCYPLFQGRRFGDISPYLSEGLQRRELDLLTAAFRAEAESAKTALQGEALAAAITRLVQATRADFGEDIALIGPDASVEGREPRVCEAAAALYDHMQNMPEPEAAALMRGLSAIAG